MGAYLSKEGSHFSLRRVVVCVLFTRKFLRHSSVASRRANYPEDVEFINQCRNAGLTQNASNDPFQFKPRSIAVYLSTFENKHTQYHETLALE